MKQLHTSLSAALALAIASILPAAVSGATLYMTASDTSSSKGSTSFNKWNINGGGTEAPSASNDYVVDGNFQMRFPNGGASSNGFIWPGNSLRIGTLGGQRGTMVFTRTNNNTWLTTTYTFNNGGLILEKGIIQPWTRNATNTITGTITVTAPESAPFDVQLGAQAQHSNTVLRIGGTLKGASGTALRVYSNTANSGAALCFAPTTPDNFAGTIIVGNGRDAIVCDPQNNKTMPGGFLMTTNSLLAPSVHDKRWTVGFLELQSGSSFTPPNSNTKWTVGDLRLNAGSTLLTKVANDNTSTITLTDSLTTAYPVNLTTPSSRTSTASTSASTVWSVLTLPTDKGNLGDNLGDFVLASQPKLFPDSLPAVYLRVSTNEAGTVQSLDLVQRQIVTLTANNSLTKWAATGFQTAVTNAASWSDEAEPHSGADYVVNADGWQLCLPPQDLLGADKSYTFPGESLTIGKETGASTACRLYSAADTLRVKILRLMDSTQFWPKPFVDSGKPFALEGDALVLPGTGATPTSLYIYGDRTYTINAPVTGTGRLEVHNNASSSKPTGTLVLAAANTNFLGRIRLVAAAKDGAYPACTLLVQDGRNLGGAFAEFKHDALELCNGSILAATNDVVLAEETRGIYIHSEGVMNVGRDATLSVAAAITYAENATLTKTGAGTLALGGKAVIPSGETASLAVGEGFLEVRSTNVVDGVAVTFASGAHLLVDPAATGDVATYGAVDLSATPFGGTLPVAFDLPAIGENDEHRYADIAVATVRDAATAAALNLSARKIPGHGVTFSTRANPDGTATILASVGRNAFVLVIR